MNLNIPMNVVYTGLAALLVALLVATAQQKWQWKVFFLLALRLAIGWQFLFEGLHKVHSHTVGPIEGNRPFSSEPYFKEAPGPLAPFMRSMNGDPTKIFAQHLTQPKEMTAQEFAKLSEAEQAALCPDVVAKQFDEMRATAETTIRANADTMLKGLPAALEKSLAEISATLEKETQAAKDDAAKAAAKKKAADAKTATEKASAETKMRLEQTLAEGMPAKLAEVNILNAKAAFARWVYGVDRRELKIPRINGDAISFTAPQRLHYLEILKKEKDLADSKLWTKMGNGYGIDVKKAQSSRADYWNAEAELVKEINGFVSELKTTINEGKAPDEKKTLTPLQWNDWFTRWFLVVVGACLLFGLFTRLSCLMAAGFLLLTYLTHPPFPWYTLPPGTEGNPLFINKNAIEFFALLVLATMKTGQWLGLDAMISYILSGLFGKETTEKTEE